MHLAFYEFADLAEVNAVTASDALKQMIGEFDRHWQGKVTRTREVVESIQGTLPARSTVRRHGVRTSGFGWGVEFFALAPT